MNIYKKKYPVVFTHPIIQDITLNGFFYESAKTEMWVRVLTDAKK